MKKTFRITALLVLLALVVSLVPAMAAETKKPSIVAETLYLGTGSYTMIIDNWNCDATDITTTSSDARVLKVDKYDFLRLTPRKVGKARITVKYTLNGKNYEISRIFTVQKYPNPIKSLEINNRKVKLKSDRKLECWWLLNGTEKNCKVNLTPAKGWKITAIKATTRRNGKEVSLKVVNNKQFSIAKYGYVKIIYTLAKGKTKFDYKINIDLDSY